MDTILDLDQPLAHFALAPSEALMRGFVRPAADAAAATRAAERATIETRQGFRLGTLGLMVRYEDGSELTEMPTVHRLPNAPAWLEGIANLHGMLVPVFDLARFLGVAPAADGKRMLLVLAHGGDAAGIAIDGLPQRLRFTAQDAADTAMAPAKLAPHLRGAALIDGALWFDLDCAALLTQLEQSLAA